MHISAFCKILSEFAKNIIWFGIKTNSKCSGTGIKWWVMHQFASEVKLSHFAILSHIEKCVTVHCLARVSSCFWVQWKLEVWEGKSAVKEFRWKIYQAMIEITNKQPKTNKQKKKINFDIWNRTRWLQLLCKFVISQYLKRKRTDTDTKIKK